MASLSTLFLQALISVLCSLLRGRIDAFVPLAGAASLTHPLTPNAKESA